MQSSTNKDKDKDKKKQKTKKTNKKTNKQTNQKNNNNVFFFLILGWLGFLFLYLS